MRVFFLNKGVDCEKLFLSFGAKSHPRKGQVSCFSCISEKSGLVVYIKLLVTKHLKINLKLKFEIHEFNKILFM